MCTRNQIKKWTRENRVQQRRQMRIRKGFYIVGKILTVSAVVCILLGAGMMDSPSLTAPIIIMTVGMVFAILAVICNRISCVGIEE